MAVTVSVIAVKRAQVFVPTIRTFVARLHSHALIFTLQWWSEFPQHLSFKECDFVISIVGHWNSAVQSTAEGISFSRGQTGYICYSIATSSYRMTSQAWPSLEITFHCPLNKHSICSRLQKSCSSPCRHLLLRAEDWQIKQKSFLATSRLQLVLGTKSKLQPMSGKRSFLSFWHSLIYVIPKISFRS